MRPIVIVLIVVALAIAGVTAYLVNYVIQSASEEQVVVEQADSQVRVMVAARDLPAGEILKPEDLDRTIQFFTGPMAIRDILWSAIMFHGIHHRGQLALMCRLAGGEAPGMYGPNREEMAAMRASAASA